jgi:regulator of replication initiation timing
VNKAFSAKIKAAVFTVEPNVVIKDWRIRISGTNILLKSSSTKFDSLVFGDEVKSFIANKAMTKKMMVFAYVDEIVAKIGEICGITKIETLCPKSTVPEGASYASAATKVRATVETPNFELDAPPVALTTSKPVMKDEKSEIKVTAEIHDEPKETKNAAESKMSSEPSSWSDSVDAQKAQEEMAKVTEQIEALRNEVKSLMGRVSQSEAETTKLRNEFMEEKKKREKAEKERDDAVNELETQKQKFDDLTEKLNEMTDKHRDLVALHGSKPRSAMSKDDIIEIANEIESFVQVCDTDDDGVDPFTFFRNFTFSEEMIIMTKRVPRHKYNSQYIVYSPELVSWCEGKDSIRYTAMCTFFDVMVLRRQ